MTINEILTTLYLLIACGVGFGIYTSSNANVQTENLLPGVKETVCIIIGLFWIISIPARVTQKLFE